MQLIKRFSIGLLALLMLAMAVVYFIPLDTYVPDVERALGGQLHEPVSVRHLRVATLPLPHLVLQDVHLGGQEGIVARTVDVVLDWTGLLAGRIAARRITVKDGSAHFEQVRKLVKLFSETPATAQSATVQELRFSGMSLLTSGMILEPIECRLNFTSAGQLERALFALDQQKLTVTLLARPDGRFTLQAQARDWTPPQLSRLQLDDLHLEGVLSGQDFVAQQFTVTSRGISAAGSGRLEFSDGWHVQAIVARFDASLAQLMALLGKPIELTGALSANGTVSGNAGTWSELGDQLLFAGDAHISQATARISDSSPHPLLLDEIRAHVVAQPEHLELSSLVAKLYGGELSGTVGINRKDDMLLAELSANGIAMQSLVEALTAEVLFTGAMDGAAKFSMSLDDVERFPENMRLNGNFHLRDGVLTKVDLAQAASNKSKAGVNGGTTRFNDLTGLLSMDTAGYHFRDLKIVSGTLKADGKLDISPSLNLDGMLDTDIKGTVGLISMPLVISGTLDEPVIRPSAAAVAGAAVGTAILGPGLGTAVGVKVGGFLKKLFGKNTGTKDKQEATSGTTTNK